MGNWTQSDEAGKVGKAFCALFHTKSGLAGVASPARPPKLNIPWFPDHSYPSSASLEQHTSSNLGSLNRSLPVQSVIKFSYVFTRYQM